MTDRSHPAHSAHSSSACSSTVPVASSHPAITSYDSWGGSPQRIIACSCTGEVVSQQPPQSLGVDGEWRIPACAQLIPDARGREATCTPVDQNTVRRRIRPAARSPSKRHKIGEIAATTPGSPTVECTRGLVSRLGASTQLHVDAGDLLAVAFHQVGKEDPQQFIGCVALFGNRQDNKHVGFRDPTPD